MKEKPSRRAMGPDDLLELQFYLDRGVEQMEHKGDRTHITTTHAIFARTENSPVAVELPYGLVCKIRTAIDNIRNGDDSREVLGLTRGRGNKIRSEIEEHRRIAIAIAYEIVLAEYGDTMSRLEMATLVAESELSTFGRDKPFTPRYVQMLHRDLSFPGVTKEDRLALGFYGLMVENLLDRLRARLEE